MGICSTTYGDLVCRGCKRFSHEVVQWNGYSKEQQSVVWQRLFEVREAAVRSAVRLICEEDFEASLVEFDLVDLADQAPWPVLAYELMRRVVRKDQPLAAMGLTPVDESLSTLTLLKAIDSDIYARSQAHYEHSYRVPAE